MRQKLIDSINKTVDEFQFLDAAKIADDIIANVLSDDIDFLKEMKNKCDSLIHGKYDKTTVQYLSQMIEDWIHELEEPS